MMRYALAVLLLTAVCKVSSHEEQQWRACVELKRDLRVPCRCTLSRDRQKSLEMSCDGGQLTAESIGNLREQPIVSFSQRNCGYERLPEALFLNSGLSLLRLDLSGNRIHRLMDRSLETQEELRELRLADNRLGDSLNPIFSSNEFRTLKRLRLLDLRGNSLKSLEEGILKGCESLEELYLDRNRLTEIPSASIKGPRAIKVLSLAANDIGTLSRGALSPLGDSLLHLDLSDNEMHHMEDGALAGLDHLLFLNASHNSLARFNSDVFKGAHSLLQLDLSANFLMEFPSDALRHLADLKFLNISNNLISEIERSHLAGLSELQVLDLSRNNIGRLGVNSFSGLNSLTKLDLSLNALRTIEESAFEGLTKLRWLSLQDNNILLVPASALTRLPSLAYLHLEFNRIAALSPELIRSSSNSLVKLVLTRNLIRDLPARMFVNFEYLNDIQLSGNMLSSIARNTFVGLEDTLLSLDLSNNRLVNIADLSLRNLVSLNLANNQLKRISPDTFKFLPRLQYLNLSSNPLYGGFPPVFPSSLLSLDISFTNLKILPTVLFLNLESLERIYIAGNHIKEINEGTFQHLYNLSTIDLSGNAIESIDNGAFVGLINLYELDLSGNQLTSFAGEYFNTGTGLEILNLANNKIDRISPTAFVIHPRLRSIDLSGNEFVQFPSDFFKSLQFLERVDLSKNHLRNINEFAYSQIARLRELDLSDNRIESVDDLAFHNSTQLQKIDLSNNSLTGLNERTMEGLLRLEFLDLSDNRIATLPETIFDQSRIRSVEKIDLSGNNLNGIPVRALQRQVSSLLSLNVARNRIAEVFTQDIVNSVMELDLSNNPLSENALRGIMGEAKILRSLNLAGTGIKTVTRLEMPFLKNLNLSRNAITIVKPSSLERTTMLDTLDLSSNKLADFGVVAESLKGLSSLRKLDLSGNAARAINESTFEGLSSLRRLDISNLRECTRIERNAFKPLAKLRSLSAHDYQKLGYFDVQGILKNMINLESIDIEIKDSSVGNEQLSIQSHPRLRGLTLRGERLRTVLSSTLVGVRSADLSIGFRNTSVDTIPAAFFFPIPRSSRVKLDAAGSKFKLLPAQLLAALDERSGLIEVTGLDSNPMSCECEAKPLWSWLKSISGRRPVPKIICREPDYLVGIPMSNLTDEYLSCDRTVPVESTDITENTSSTTRLSSSVTYPTSSSEPEIIWTVAPTTQNTRNKMYDNHPNSANVGSSNTDDTLIIGIVGGVVAFIAIIVIVICICRLRWSSNNIPSHEAQMAAVAASMHEASMIRPPSNFSGKINHEMYMGTYNGSTLDRGGINPMLAASHPSTPMQMMPIVHPMHMMHSMTPPQTPAQPIYGYYDNSPLPVYMTCPSENKFDR